MHEDHDAGEVFGQGHRVPFACVEVGHGEGLPGQQRGKVIFNEVFPNVGSRLQGGAGVGGEEILSVEAVIKLDGKGHGILSTRQQAQKRAALGQNRLTNRRSKPSKALKVHSFVTCRCRLTRERMVGRERLELPTSSV